MKAIEPSKAAMLNQMIDEAGQIAIVAHTRVDGDAVGSCTALMHYLSELRGKKVGITFAETIPESISFIVPASDNPSIHILSENGPETLDWIKGSDLAFCMDCNSFSRTAGLEKEYNDSKAGKVLIDHHLNPESGQFDISFAETEISSTAELLFHILKKMPDISGDAGKLPKVAAEALMAGMTTDTNNFGNSVFPSTLDMASELLATGVDRGKILYELYNRFRENRVRVMGHMLKDNLVITPAGTAYMILDKKAIVEYDIREGETEGFVNIPLSIDNVVLSIFLKEDDGFFRVSIRSKEGISANRCAQEFFNGGGHELAAGGKLFFPKDIAGPEKAGAYVEKVTELFLKK